MTDKPEVWLTPRMVAEQMHVTVGTVREWYKSGKLKVTKVGGSIRISQTALAAFIQARYEADQKGPPAATDLI